MNHHRRMWLWTNRLTRWALAGVFLYAGISKVQDPALLARQIKNYHLAPWWAVYPMAITLPWVEITAAVLLVLGVWIIESVSVLGALSVLFIAAVGWALHKDLNIQCGCFGGDSMAGWGHIAGNVGLLVLAAVTVLAYWRSRPARSEQPGHILSASQGVQRE